MATRAEIAKPVLTLGLLAAGLTVLIVLIAGITRERIVHNEQAWIRQRLDALVPPATHDNDLLDDSIAVRSADLLGTAQPVRIYRARRNGVPVAAVIRVDHIPVGHVEIAPRGLEEELVCHHLNPAARGEYAA